MDEREFPRIIDEESDSCRLMRSAPGESAGVFQEEASRAILLHAQKSTRLWTELLADKDPNTIPWNELPTTSRSIISNRFSDIVTDTSLNLADVSLSGFKIPRQIAFVDHIPKTPNGKSNRSM